MENVCCAFDCGRIVNPDAAIHIAEAAITNAIGTAFYSEMTFKEGVPKKNNFSLVP